MISFIVPVYHAAETLCELHRRLSTEFDSIPGGFEIIFVEDCSGDNSWEIIQQLVAKDNRVCGIRMTRNYGQHNALLCGIREANGDIIVTLDDDLQHPPEEIHKLLSKLTDEECDVVYGPPEREQHGILRDFYSQITKMALQGVMGAANARQVSALRVFRANLRTAFSGYSSPTVNIDVLLAWSAEKFAAVRVQHQERKFGQSGYTMSKLIRHALNMMTGFSTRPLQFASLMGFSFSLFGLFILFYVVARWAFQSEPVPGFAFIACIVSIFSGVQLLAIGVIGEYIARIHLRSMGQPPYVVGEKLQKKINERP